MNAAEVIVLAAVVLGGGWYVDVRLHPTRPCPRCSGSKKNAGSRPTAWGDCRRCNKTGEVRRWGAKREERK